MPRPLTVTAIIAAYNEEDVIGCVLADLVEQGVRVHLLDHGSTDGTVAEAERFLGRGLVNIERLDSGEFSLTSIIRRKEVLAAELDTDWLLNADADEFRESPWPGVGFIDGLHEVDRMGFNAIDFAVVNFHPVNDAFQKGDDPRSVFRFCEPGAVFDRLQVRCWKKQPGPLDLVSTAGHEARFPDRRVFPVRFLLRHYPIRSQAHGERKVFQERLPRFAAEERARGWHVQYDGLREGASFLREPSSLTPYDPWATRLGLFLRHRGVEALEEERSRIREELEQTRAELARATTRLGEALGAAQMARGNMEALGGEVTRSREAAAEARGELASAASRLAEALGAMQKARGTVEALEGELSRSRGELASVGGRLAESEVALQSARGRSAKLEEELSRSHLDLTESRRKLASERDELARSRVAYERESAHLRAELTQSRAAYEREAAHLGAELTGGRAAHEREATHLKGELERLRGELFQRDEEIARQREERAALVETSERRQSALQYRLDSVLTSRVWKWTSPIRRLLDALSRG